MEALQPTPSKITKTCSTLHRRLEEIDAQIIQFTNFPIDTPSLDLLAQQIQKKLGFIRNILNAEISSHGTKSYDISEIEERLTELEAKFYRSNVHPVNVDRSDESESDSGSVCESCLNNDGDNVSSVCEAPEMVVPPPEVLCEAEISDGGKRRWWRTVAVLTTVSAGLMVSFCNYLVSNQHEDFLTPT
ncbi:hypothetical protein L1987_62439 [Smallanthus sonchifolius]|uniref:Uncharacterized protein n=1 Tax=Smallanthus sonchifolius TaxID=185202 RepID=A0ACB9CAC9_9ASTR|nr:hypothetical protein L1987_62439 [Smallanthus sonchifolius]